MDNEYSMEYLELLSRLSEQYRQCLDGFIREFSDANQDNLSGIVLYGGLVRDGSALPEWSDIDIAVIYQEMSRRDIFKTLQSDSAINGYSKFGLI